MEKNIELAQKIWDELHIPWSVGALISRMAEALRSEYQRGYDDGQKSK